MRKQNTSVNNRDIQFQQYKRETEQEQLIGYWMKTRKLGVSRKDLVNHPQVNDVMLLIKYRDEFVDMNHYHKNKFDSAWRWCYSNKYALKRKHLNWLEHGAKHTINKRKNQARAQAKAQALIKANRG